MAQSIITQVSKETDSYTPCPTPDTGLLQVYDLCHCARLMLALVNTLLGGLLCIRWASKVQLETL